ncbi:MAG: nitrile hydratase subunit alpha, partial [SAR324 cluster bacterium]|nr:nitrile hydratase subunit alpha [SAR324 cluster bacterium]
MTNTHGSHSGHDHSHTDFQPDIKEPNEHWEFLEITLRELLVDKGILSAREIQGEIEAWEKKSPEKGAEIVARAWADEDFKARLLEDANQTIRDFGIEVDVLKMVA